MLLNTTDLTTIASQMKGESGSVAFEKGNETLTFDYEVIQDGYSENDYNSGTGAFVTTSIEVILTDIECFNEDGEDCELIGLEEYEIESILAA